MGLYDIPLSRRRSCVFCADIIDSAALGVYELVQGWSMNRKGGTNSVALKRSLNQFACGVCMDKLKSGVPHGQQTLFTWDAD